MTATGNPVKPADLLEGQGLVVCSVRYPMISKVMVELLEALLRGAGLAGAILSIDRPHTYISHLLEKRGVPQEKLVYIDAVTRISGEAPPSTGGSELLPAPFCVNILSDFMTVCGPKIAEKRAGFLLVDNLSALTPYVSEECMRRFLENLVQLGRQVPGLRCVFVLDRQSHSHLYELLKKMGAREVSI